MSDAPASPATHERGRILPPFAEIMAIETRRSRLPSSRHEDPTAWREGFAYLARTYRPAMIQYVGAIVRRYGSRLRDHEIPEEIVQAWFASSLEKDRLVPAEAPMRSFRAYLKTHLRRFTKNDLRARFADRRSPDREVALDDDDVASEADAAEESIFDRSLLDVAFHAALRRMRAFSPLDAAVVEILLRSDGEPGDDLPALVDRRSARPRDLARRAGDQLAILFRQELERTVPDDDELTELLRTYALTLP